MIRISWRISVLRFRAEYIFRRLPLARDETKISSNLTSRWLINARKRQHFAATQLTSQIRFRFRYLHIRFGDGRDTGPHRYWGQQRGLAAHLAGQMWAGTGVAYPKR